MDYLSCQWSKGRGKMLEGSEVLSLIISGLGLIMVLAYSVYTTLKDTSEENN